ncbi:MAG: ABC transporter substrate-binding protein [Actinomycetota bacterium]
MVARSVTGSPLRLAALRFVGALVAFALVAAACGDDDGDTAASASGSASASASEPAEDASASEPAEAATVSFTDDLGRTVDVPVDPQRIIAFNEFSHAEPLLALGAPLIGMTDQGGGEFNPPTAAAYDVSGVTSVGGFSELNVEVITELQPDLILAYSHTGEWYHNVDVEVLQEIAPTVALNENKTRDDFHRAVAELVGYTDEFEEQREAYFARIDELKPQLSEDLSVLVIASPWEGGISIHSISNPNPTSAIPTDLGITMPAVAQADDIYVDVSPELILEEFQADVIFYEARGASVVETPLWEELPAVQAGQVYSIDTAAGTSYLHSLAVLDEMEAFLLDADPTVVAE